MSTPSRTSMLRMSVLPDSGLRVNKEDFQGAVANLTQETYESLNSIWKEAGYEEVECHGLLGDILTKFKALCASELSAEQQILDHAKQQVVVKLEEFSSLCAKLGRTCEEETAFGENYADRLAELERRTFDIGIEISERSNVITAKAEEINTLLTSLGEEGPPEFEGNELSDTRLESMIAYCKELIAIRELRVTEMREVAEDCLKAFQELVIPEEGVGSLPQAVMYSDLDQAILRMQPEVEFPFVHKDDFQRLITRAQALSSEKETRRQELASNGAEIARMWTQLRVPTADREAFQKSFKMNLSMETLNKGRAELARLKELRLTSLGTVIEAIRDEIAAYWEELGVTTAQQREDEFPLFTADVKTLADSAVEEHELFCVSLKEKVDVLRPILSKISRRECVVKERVELEHIMQHPERLSARGPTAREDRKREEEMSRRVKGLEKYTKELLIQIEAWEEQSASPFLFAGERYVDRVNAQEEEYADTKNNLRNSRRKKDGKPEGKASANVVAKKFSSTMPANGLSHTTPNPKKIGMTSLQPATPASSSNIPKSKTTTPAVSSVKKTPASASGSKIPLHKENHAAASNQNGIPDKEALYKGSSNSKPMHSRTLSARMSSDSHESGETMITSATEIKERPSTATVERHLSETF